MKKVISRFTKTELFGYGLILFNYVVGLTILGFAEKNMKYNDMLFAMTAILVLGMVFAMLNLKKRMILFLFYCTMFLFLASRIIIPAIQGSSWWYNYSVEANCFAVRAIAYSAIALSFGTALLEISIKIFQRENSAKKDSEGKIAGMVTQEALMKVVRIILAVCMACFLIHEFDKLLLMQGRPYEDYFSCYVSRMPFVINFPASVMPYFLCAFLALKPSKKESFFWLMLYVISSLPMLKIGVRNPFILNCVFAFVYYVLRDNIRKPEEKKWIGKWEKGLILVSIPVLVLFLGAYNYIRADKEVGMSPINLVTDFAYKQGTTYDTVLQGYVYEDELPMREEQIYTLGPLTDSFFYNSITKHIFDLEDIGEGNSLRKALNGHTFSHAISYVVMGKNYIAGNGRGSSYIIENYLDWGYPGVVGFSIFLGLICAGIPAIFGKKWIISVICLNVVTNFLFTARAESTAFLTFLISYKFWICMIGCLVLGKLWMILIDKGRIKFRDEK